MAKSSGGTRGASGGSLGMSDSAIERIANQTPDDLKALSPQFNPRVMKGEISVVASGNHIINVYNTQIESDVRKVLEQSPARPKTTKGNAEFVKQYDVFHEKVNAAYQKAISDYKKEVSIAKSKTEKIFMAQKVVQYKQYLSEQSKAIDWIHRKFKAQ